MTRRQQADALDDGTRTVKEICAELGCGTSTIYQARFERKHPNQPPLRKRPAPRADLAVALLAQHEAAGMDRAEAIRQIAGIMGIRVQTVRDYLSRLMGTQHNVTDASDAGKPRPRCRCALTLFSPEELATGRCNNCLPTSAVELLGRRDEPVGVMTLPR